jgi:hypothetical protein
MTLSSRRSGGCGLVDGVVAQHRPQDVENSRRVHLGEHSLSGPQVLADRLTTADPDVLRELLSMFIHRLMGARRRRAGRPAPATEKEAGDVHGDRGANASSARRR